MLDSRTGATLIAWPVMVRELTRRPCVMAAGQGDSPCRLRGGPWTEGAREAARRSQHEWRVKLGLLGGCDVCATGPAPKSAFANPQLKRPESLDAAVGGGGAVTQPQGPGFSRFDQTVALAFALRLQSERLEAQQQRHFEYRLAVDQLMSRGLTMDQACYQANAHFARLDAEARHRLHSGAAIEPGRVGPRLAAHSLRSQVLWPPRTRSPLVGSSLE